MINPFIPMTCMIDHADSITFPCLSQDFPLGGWSVERSVDGEPAIVYKFTPKYVLKSGSFVTVSYRFS